MTFARVKGRPSDAQRRIMRLIAQYGNWMASAVPKATREKLVVLELCELRCRHCHSPEGAIAPVQALDIVLTERGRKYLANYDKAYGSGLT